MEADSNPSPFRFELIIPMKHGNGFRDGLVKPIFSDPNHKVVVIYIYISHNLPISALVSYRFH